MNCELSISASSWKQCYAADLHDSCQITNDVAGSGTTRPSIT